MEYLLIALLIWLVISIVWSWRQLNIFSTGPDPWYAPILAAPVLLILFVAALIGSLFE